MTTDVPNFSKEQLDAMAIEMRNRNQRYIPQLGGHPISLHDWLRREYEKRDFKISDMPNL